MSERAAEEQTSVASSIIAEALSWLGTPYRHQGMRKGIGCDCIGLVLGVWQAVYGTAPEWPGAYAPDWAEAGGEERLLAATRRHCIEKQGAGLSAGDLILFRWRPHLPAKHAAIMVGTDRFIHAHERNTVVVSALVPQWQDRIAGVFAFPERP